MSQQPEVRPHGVNDALTMNRAESQDVSRRPEKARRRRNDVENDDFARFAVRIIRAHGRRIAGGDVEGLRELLALRDELDAATQVAVDGLRQVHGFSWGEMAA